MKIKILLSVLAGLVTGIIGTWSFFARTTGRAFDDLYLVGVMDQANVALQIRAGNQMNLLSNIETALPNYALAVDRDFRGKSGSTNALWMVKAYYERNQISVPTEIRSILDSLPPKPPTACQIRLRALDKAVNTNTMPTPSR